MVQTEGHCFKSQPVHSLLECLNEHALETFRENNLQLCLAASGKGMQQCGLSGLEGLGTREQEMPFDPLALRAKPSTRTS